MTEQVSEYSRDESMMSLGIIPARTPHDVIVQATSIAKELAKIIKDNRLAVTIQGRDFVKVEGWSTMGAMLGVLPREVTELTRRFEDGSYEAVVELIRITDGSIIGRASAFVGMDEKDRNGKPTWANRAEFARRSMAITRATGKAFRLGFSWIMGLAGYEATPAEEMGEVVDGTSREATPGNNHPDQKAWEAWSKLVEEAEGIAGVVIPAMDPNSITTEQLRQEYKKLKLEMKAAAVSSEPAPNGNGNDITGKVITAAVEGGLSENEYSARQALKHCKVELASIEDGLDWMRRYRGFRDLGGSPEQAAQKANEGKQP